MFSTIFSAFLLVVSVGVVVDPSAPPATPSAAFDAEVKLGSALTAVAENDIERAVGLLDELMSAPGFASEPSTHRYQVTAVAGLLAQAQERKEDAKRLLSAATAFDEAPLQVWRACADASLALADGVEAARCLAQSVRLWPTSAADLNVFAVSEIASNLADADNTAAHTELLESLFDAGWASDEKIIDFHWVRLAELLLAQGRADEAADVAAHVDDPRSVVWMRVDARFDALTRLRPGLFDVDRAIARTAARDDARVAALPTKLAPAMLQHANWLDARRFKDVMESADRIIEATRSGEGATKYEDFDEMYPWILNQRAQALAGLGRWDEATRALEQGARRPAGGGLNVSQIINLASLYGRIGRPEDAIAALAEIGSMSPYGLMQRELARLQAAIALGDKALAADALAYMRAHRDDSFDALQDALLAVGDLDEAAELLVERLRDDETRGDALLAVQTWTPAAQTRWDKRQSRRWRRVLARSDVQAAVRAVGRRETFPLQPQFY